MIEFTIACPGLEELIRKLDRAPEIFAQELFNGMERSLLIAEQEITDRTPVDYGYLRNNITGHVEATGRDITGIVAVNNVRYAPFVEFGTRPHEIVPRFAKALRFQPGPAAFRLGSQRPLYRVQRGQRAGALVGRRSSMTAVFARRVQHPGTKGAHMFRDGTLAAWPRVQAQFARALGRATRRLARGE